MKRSLLKCACAIALYMCMAGVLFAALSPVRTAHAATTHAASPAISCPGIRLTQGATWSPGGYWSWTACSGRGLKLIYQDFDSHFVLYCNGNAIWADNGPYGQVTDYQPRDVIFQSDGNLVMYDYSVYSQSVYPNWATGTNGEGAQYMQLQGDGNVVIYTGSNSALWATNTRGLC